VVVKCNVLQRDQEKIGSKTKIESSEAAIENKAFFDLLIW